MNLEDLFKQKPREEYVTAPVENPATLEKFFAERKYVKPTPPKQTAPVEQAKVEEIKQKFSSQPVQQEVDMQQAAAQTGNKTSDSSKEMESYAGSGETPVNQYTGYEMPMPQYASAKATSDLVGMEKIRGQVDGMMPERGMSDWLSVLAPLATEAVFGGGKAGGVSYGIAGKAATDMVGKDEARRTKLEDRLMEIEKARAIAGAKASGKNTGKSAELMGPNGEAILAPQEYAFGKQLWKKPETDTFSQKVALMKMKGQLEEKIASGKASAKEKKDLRDLEVKLSKEWSSDEFTKGTRKVADAYKRIEKLDPENTNRIEEMGAIFDLMKSLDPQSVVRESEQAMAIGARSYTDVVDYFDSIISGERRLTPTQMNNIKKFAAGLYRSRMASQSELNKGYTERAGRYELNPENIVQNISNTPIPKSLPPVGTKIKQGGHVYTVGKNGELL